MPEGTSAATVKTISVEAAKRRRARMAIAQQESKMLRTLVTPEGAVIRLQLALAVQRAGAFLIDLAIQAAVIVGTALAVMFMAAALGFGGLNFAMSFYLVFTFVFRNFYFIFFEVGRKAATPGKRALGLRVSAQDGGRLTANAVLARNFIREIEVGLPLTFIGMVTDSLSALIALLGLLWSGVFLLFPIFNKDKMRVGDVIAGTWVIKAPKIELLEDISTGVKAEHATRFAFTPQQADAYGIHELHVLEDVLRQAQAEVISQVAERIRAKIDWRPMSGETDLAFLEAYYAALRQRLEQRMLLGNRKTDKYDVN